MTNLQTIDYIVFFIYLVIVTTYGLFIYRKKTSASSVGTGDFFLAEGQLTWWAIGASLIASNISAEQFIGMSGNGFRLGLAISSYEWLAAVSLIIVAVFFMPVYLKHKIYTMPQYLETRYNSTVALIMAVFWLFLYIFVNLTSILYLGTIAINSLSGGEHFHLIMLLLAVFALIITLGGMKVIGYTDVIQVVVLIAGGLITTYIALCTVSEKSGAGSSAFSGFKELLHQAPDHFHMIFTKPTAGSSAKEISNYSSLPGLAMLAAGMWIANLNYWGCNQYITQRALGADLNTARKGILFSALLKLLMPLLVVVPGIAAYVLHQQGELQTQMLTNGEFREDNAYSAVLSFLPAGLKGLSMAALTAAIVASLAGKANSVSTIFTLDIFKKYINSKASEKKLVYIGRITILLAFALALIVNWKDSLGIGGRGGFEYIQKYTGYISPAVFPVFLLGFFWKRTNAYGALAGIISGVLLAVLFDKFLPDLAGNETFLYTAYPNASGNYEIPFLIQMGWVFFFTSIIILLVSLLTSGQQASFESKSVSPINENQNLSFSMKALIALILVVCFALYICFW